MQMPKSIFPNSASDRAASRFWKWLRDSKGYWNTFNTITTGLISFLQATISSLKALHMGECLVRRGRAGKLPAGVSATSSSFGMAEYRACTSISTPTTQVRTICGFDGVRIVNGEEEKSMSYSISTLMIRNLRDVFGENDPARRRAAIDEIYTEDCVFYDPSQLPSLRNRETVGWSDGYRVVLVTRPLTPGQTSSLPGTVGLPPYISFSTNYPER